MKALTNCRILSAVCLTAIATFTTSASLAQTSSQGTWAAADDPDAKLMIEAERKWGIESCVPSNVIDEYVADDFVGTSPAGPIYTKADLRKEHASPVAARDCKLLSARVRYFGPTVAIIYGSEIATLKDAAGKDYNRTLIWTDTWMKRNGKWKIIAVQDMDAPKK